MSGSTLMALVMNIEIKWRDSRGRMGKSGAGYHNMDEGLFNMAEALWSGVPHLNPRKSGVASLGTGAQGPDPDSGGAVSPVIHQFFTVVLTQHIGMVEAERRQ